MKKICKVILAAAAIAALAAPAMAAPGDLKLKVRDDGNTADVFTVSNTGTVVGAKLGMGTGSPQTPIHLNLPSALGVTYPVGTLLYSTASGFSLSTQDNTPAADLVAADGTNTTGFRGAIRGVRSRGTLAVPSAAAAEDLVFSLIGGVYDGGAVRNTADINFTVDGAVSSNVAPQRISFRTRTGGTGVYVERLTIKNDGKIIFGSAGIPVFADNTAAASLAAGTVYRTSTGVLMIKF